MQRGVGGVGGWGVRDSYTYRITQNNHEVGGIYVYVYRYTQNNREAGGSTHCWRTVRGETTRVGPVMLCCVTFSVPIAAIFACRSSTPCTGRFPSMKSITQMDYTSNKSGKRQLIHASTRAVIVVCRIFVLAELGRSRHVRFHPPRPHRRPPLLDPLYRSVQFSV